MAKRFVCITMTATLMVAAPAAAQTECDQAVGPDLIVADMSGMSYPAESIDGEFFDAFSSGRTVCNIGDQNLLFQAFPSNQHPAVTRGLFKLKDGRIEQVGMSWVSHGLTALTQNLCCTCNGAGGVVLGKGCSDPSTAGYQGTQSIQGPRWEVNAFTGVFPSGGPANPPFSGSTARRLRAKSAELEPSSPLVKYFAEINAVSAHEATFGNQFNNASYRQVVLSGGPDNFNIATTGLTQREQAAIHAWKDNDPAVVETDVQIPDEGLFILAAKATDLGNGTWYYEYAVENINSDRSARSFSVPLPPGVQVTNIGFHDVDYHSGDGIPLPDGPDADTDPDWRNFDGTDWAVTQTGDSITWSTQTFAENENANALRWATLYNFRFDADRAPTFTTSPPGQITIETFKVPGTVSASTIVPSAPPCLADIANGDGEVNIDDLFAVIAAWGPCAAPPASCLEDIDDDGDVDIDDLFAVIAAWGPCG